MTSIMALGYAGKTVSFHVDSPITRKRFYSFLTKEPDTIEWLNTLGGDDVLWDIGANIGIYAFPAAVRCREVWAFEPHPANYHDLWRNTRINPSLTVHPVHLALGKTLELAQLYIPDTSPGAAMTSISSVGYRGRPIHPDTYSVPVPAINGDLLVRLGPTPPTVVKIDVDGIEPDIIDGMAGLLKTHIREALVETDAHRSGHNEMIAFMEKLGFSFDPVRAMRARRDSGPNAGVGNILFRKEAPHA